MKRTWLIILAGLALAVAGYAGLYFAATANSRHVQRSPQPELAWLKAEFHLSDSEFERISRMHRAYLEGCARRCRQIDQENQHLKALLASSDQITPEISQTLAETAQLRAECQKQMLQHFYDVSRTMPPAQGKRYLAWIQAETILPDTHAQMSH